MTYYRRGMKRNGFHPVVLFSADRMPGCAGSAPPGKADGRTVTPRNMILKEPLPIRERAARLANRTGMIPGPPRDQGREPFQVGTTNIPGMREVEVHS